MIGAMSASALPAGPPAGPIEFWSDFISPYGYLGATQVEAVAARHGRAVTWRPLLLGVTVLKVMGLKPLPETPLKGDYLTIDLPRLAALYGVPLTDKRVPGVNGVAAARALLWLRGQDAALAARFAHAIYRRLWVRGEDITPPEAVLEEAAALGAPRAPLAEWLAGEPAKAALKAEVEEAVARGIFGAPTFVVDGEPIWGADRLWMLDHRLRHGGWVPLEAPAPPARLSSPGGCSGAG
jgi:2-hydroxychromene-2-carboxylate isomerase